MCPPRARHVPATCLPCACHVSAICLQSGRRVPAEFPVLTAVYGQVQGASVAASEVFLRVGQRGEGRDSATSTFQGRCQNVRVP